MNTLTIVAGFIIGLIIIAALFARRNERVTPKHTESLSNKELIDTMDRLNARAAKENK